MKQQMTYVEEQIYIRKAWREILESLARLEQQVKELEEKKKLKRT